MRDERERKRKRECILESNPHNQHGIEISKECFTLIYTFFCYRCCFLWIFDSFYDCELYITLNIELINIWLLRGNISYTTGYALCLHHHHHHHVAPSARISLTLCHHLPDRPLLSAGLRVYIPYRHRVVLCRFGQVGLLLPVHVKGSTGVYHLWAHPYFSSSVQHVWLV